MICVLTLVHITGTQNTAWVDVIRVRLGHARFNGKTHQRSEIAIAVLVVRVVLIPVQIREGPAILKIVTICLAVIVIGECLEPRWVCVITLTGSRRVNLGDHKCGILTVLGYVGRTAVKEANGNIALPVPYKLISIKLVIYPGCVAFSNYRQTPATGIHDFNYIRLRLNNATNFLNTVCVVIRIPTLGRTVKLPQVC
ncbi:MAG: hypothetical protein OKBPIBMD_02196 [Chlorobi bacterium]|nr:hypothetical protein [Chlorobiota bacterium]